MNYKFMWEELQTKINDQYCDNREIVGSIINWIKSDFDSDIVSFAGRGNLLVERSIYKMAYESILNMMKHLKSDQENCHCKCKE